MFVDSDYFSTAKTLSGGSAILTLTAKKNCCLKYYYYYILDVDVNRTLMINDIGYSGNTSGKVTVNKDIKVGDTIIIKGPASSRTYYYVEFNIIS